MADLCERALRVESGRSYMPALALGRRSVQRKDAIGSYRPRLCENVQRDPTDWKLSIAARREGQLWVQAV